MKVQFAGVVCVLSLVAASGTPAHADQAKSRKPPAETSTSAPREAVPRTTSPEPRATSSTSTTTKAVLSVEQVRVIKEYYVSQHRSLPPGLQKKYARTGQLPPGWQKKMEPLPVRIESSMPPLVSPYRRGVIDGHAVIYNSQAGTIVDVAVLF